MDTAWIQVFVLTLAECVAPAGKTVCQEQQFDLQFLTRNDCEYALEQLLTLKEESSAVIVNRNLSRCTVSAREKNVFESPEDVSKASSGTGDWTDPDPADSDVVPSSLSHSERLAALPECESYGGQGACRMGDIIVESANQGQVVEVWRRED
jgi:hypothetical protein